MGDHHPGHLSRRDILIPGLSSDRWKILNAASLDDVKEWFKTYYGPSNAVLSIAGDVKPEEILGKGEEILWRYTSGSVVDKT